MTTVIGARRIDSAGGKLSPNMGDGRFSVEIRPVAGHSALSARISTIFSGRQVAVL